MQNYPPFPIYEHTHTFECHERQYKSIRILTHRQMQKNFLIVEGMRLQIFNNRKVGVERERVCVRERERES